MMITIPSVLDRSSSNDIYTIIPETKDSNKALTAGDQNGNRDKKPNKAPKGSAISVT